jgi:hypothetical protein
MIKLKNLIESIAYDRTKPPKGYKVTTSVVAKDMGVNWYDCMVWKDGRVILSTSMTMMESKQEAYRIGVRRAWDIHDEKGEWS